MSLSPVPILELIEAFRRSKVMFAAVSLQVFDHLQEEPATAESLASRVGANANALERLLDACATLGLVTREEGRYRNTETAQVYLTRSSPASLTGYIEYSNSALFPLWHRLEDAVREGSHRWQQAFGLEGGLFSHFFRTEEAKREFLMGMHGFGQISSPAVVAAFDLSPFHTLVDLGGATGHLALAACERYPHLRAIVFDLPGVLPLAAEQKDRTPFASRVTLQAGDFFSDSLPEADLYAVGRILHDWSESNIRVLLARLFERLPPGGALLVAERLLDDNKLGPLGAQLQSLNMLVCTEGKERTAGEYAALLREAGFSRIEARRTGTPLDAILAIKEAGIQ